MMERSVLPIAVDSRLSWCVCATHRLASSVSLAPICHYTSPHWSQIGRPLPTTSPHYTRTYHSMLVCVAAHMTMATQTTLKTCPDLDEPIPQLSHNTHTTPSMMMHAHSVHSAGTIATATRTTLAAPPLLSLRAVTWLVCQRWRLLRLRQAQTTH